ncbi:E3 ubiquitin-protein ligase RNF128 isoform X2 [Oenanthe melanoleuca]|uniref:E3 ubiquitin-protein ligase RNF128 isoform X2 n=1 Tax=Oenanthe melanoleuca TaxID=2939378 RepID=UPI0024C11D0F|nr:E3 ubiquitin-protein ligase RNF128 isoform X2 [Oenanthe melanoleuca]
MGLWCHTVLGAFLPSALARGQCYLVKLDKRCRLWTQHSQVGASYKSSASFCLPGAGYSLCNADELSLQHYPSNLGGAEKIVAIMIGNVKGMEILQRIQSGMKVTMVIEVGKKRSLSMNIFTILFISVSFFIVAAATVGCYVSYSARRLIIARAHSREQRQLRARAKKAIEQMQLRTLKEGDKEIGPDGDSCVVCFEQYKPNDVMRVLTCNHVFHKTCIDPWLLEHGTCPLCKCDILKVLGVEMDVEPQSESVQAPGSSGQRPLFTVTIVNEEDSLSETASSGYDSVQGPDESAQEAHVPSEHDNMHPVSEESQASTVTVLSQGDNPGFEGDETQVCEGKVVCEVTF